MANRTNASTAYDSYEYYLDYLDLIPVDEKKLKASKHSIVIAFWVSLAAFVVFLFLLLLSMSWPASPQTRKVRTGGGTMPSTTQRAPGVSASTSPSVSGSNPSTTGPPRGPRCLYRAQSRNQVAEHRAPEHRVQQLQQESPSTSAPFHPPQGHPARLWELALDGDPHGTS
ncbi:melanocortin-2 receptor accessory protein [Lagenorhynchus albirostris]|uniref:melanocortin-2 receptor accessory protein n=1 Tax=Lagenorhynchus albirostris TaxID=27610 RepID=UPI0028E6D4B3|nr:melanocortin-2 receptor accessory protein [Lagenorhynchus albirostris]